LCQSIHMETKSRFLFINYLLLEIRSYLQATTTGQLRRERMTTRRGIHTPDAIFAPANLSKLCWWFHSCFWPKLRLEKSKNILETTLGLLFHVEFSKKYLYVDYFTINYWIVASHCVTSYVGVFFLKNRTFLYVCWL
jgi:hypothetical protein